MKKGILVILASFVVLFVSGQATNTDKIYKHSGEVLQVKILKISDLEIIYKYPDKELQETISKLAVDKIEYENGVAEKISDKVVIHGKQDWEKVQIIEDKSQIEGLKKGNEIQGKTSTFNWRTTNGSGKIALKKLKEEAADVNAPFVLLTEDKTLPTI